jgi:signal transduction histidine kinase
LLAALLGVTLLVTAGLTFMGQRALKDHGVAVERILRDNAAFAAFRYVEAAQLTITSVFRTYYGEVKDAKFDLRHVEFPALTLPAGFLAQCSCDPSTSIGIEFAYDFATDAFVFKNGELDSTDQARLANILRTHVTDKLHQGWQAALARSQDAPQGKLVAFAVRQDPPTEGEPNPPRQYAYGFLAEPVIMRIGLMKRDALNQRMPNSDSSVARDRYSVYVSSYGQEILRDGLESQYYYDHSMAPAFGGMDVRVSVNHNAVPALAGIAASALGQSRTLQIGLLLVASIMIVAALILARRQTELAAAREEFVSNVSHELRTPLAQIRMFAETLLLGRVRNEVERRRSVENIDQEAKRLTAQVENVLSLSRVDRGTARLAPAATELAPTIRDVVDTFSQLPRSRSAEYRLELEDRLVATVDPNAFRQILLNLLDNAIKYGPVGQRVSVGLAMFEEHARLWVDDEGPGIPTRERDRVFETFYRTSNHLASDVAGSGIGLAVVRELAGLLGGKAWVDDAPGGGARLVVEFPEAYLRAEEAAGSWAAAS